MDKLKRLQARIGYQFSDTDLLALALSHRSVGRNNNERLEFLGDSILNHVIAEALYQRFDEVREGELSRLRASLVKGETLAAVAREIELGDYLRLGSGERKSGGHRRESILADALEAVAGAVLLDGGFEACRAMLLELFSVRLQDLGGRLGSKDPKTELQEYLQGRGLPLPTYSLLKVSGQDHDQSFTCACELVRPSLRSQGQGNSRRRAEQAAAGAALAELKGQS